ncbi:MAG: ATP-binding protein [Desulforhopalus sp.]|nr:ATP-binding protein [Desulforhopalus sp.]
MSRFFHLHFRTKIELGITALVLITALLLGLAAGRIAADALKLEHRKRGLALAEILATRAVDPMLARDLLRLKNIVDDLKNLEGDILYAFIQDADHRVMVHSFPGGFPVDLLQVEVAPEELVGTHLLSADGQLIDDFAVVMTAAGDHLGTVRLGISRATIQAVVSRLLVIVAAIALAVLILAVLAGTWFARRITAQLALLKGHAEDIIRGNLDLQAGPVLERNCWEIMECGKTECPAYGDVRRRCWYLAGTMCVNCQNLDYPAKIDSCRNCRIHQLNRGDEIQDLAEAFDVMAISLDRHIREIREAEEALRHQQQLMQTILDATPDLISLLDRELIHRSPNRAFARSVGLSLDKVVGRNDFDLFAETTAKRRSQRNQEVLASGRRAELEEHLESEDGERWLHTVVVPVYDTDQQISGVLWTARDITELRKTQLQLIQAQKMESLGKLAGGVAHEINTPLGVILGYAQLLQDDVEAGSQAAEDLQTIEKQAKVCRKIVADLLGFSRQTKSSKAGICLNNTLLEAIALIRHSFGMDQVAIVVDLDDRTLQAYADAEKLKQVWINLLNNARDAMPKGGTIGVKSRLDSAREMVQVWFADSGEGISEDNLKRIFDPFFTTKQVGKGTGLGLAVSFGIIEEHGGTIQVESPVPPNFTCQGFVDLPKGSGGTLFIIELPYDSKV